MRSARHRWAALPWPPLAGTAILAAGFLFAGRGWEGMLRTSAVYAVATVGLLLLIGYAGQFTLGHGVSVAAGAYGAAILTTKLGIDPWLAFAFAPVAGMVVGLVVGLPALRLSSHTLAMVTLAVAIALPSLLDLLTPLTGGPLGLTVPRLPGIDRTEMKYLLLACVLVSLLLAWLLLRNRWGTILQAIGEDELGARAAGIRVFRAKALTFALASALGGLAGGLYAFDVQYVIPQAFTVDLALVLLAALALGGARSIVGVVIGCILIAGLPIVFSSLGTFATLVYGAVLLVSQLLIPDGLPSALGRWIGRLLPRRGGEAPAAIAPVAPAAIARPATTGRAAPSLRVAGVVKSFGGVRALRGVDLEVRGGEVHALLGPNGSGKSTLINVLSGTYPADAGTVEVDGRPAASMAAMRRRGVSRTFQTPRALPGLLLRESTALPLLDRLDVRPRTARERGGRMLDALGLGALVHRRPQVLTYGGLRLAELARTLVDHPDVVLLDEPAAGLSHAEIAELVAVIRALVASGCAVVLVEHHLEMVAELADVATVLHEGTVLAHGPVADVLRDDEVVRAYIGTGRSAS
jgi:branched-chain amino acid transport system permease protein